MGKQTFPSSTKNRLSGADAEQLGQEFLIAKGL